MKTIRVKVIETQFNEKTNMISFLVLDLEKKDSKEFTLMYPAIDLITSFGISEKKAQELPPEAYRKFLSDIKGKEINLEMHTTCEVSDVDKMNNQDVKSMHRQLDQYPWEEAAQEIVDRGEGELKYDD